MKLSENTISVLKNFSFINPSLQVRPGNVVKTISPQKTIFASAKLAENFEQGFAIYDMSKFLGVLSLLDAPDIEFFDDHLKVVSGKNSVRYVYADPETIIAAPDKQIVFPSTDVEFDIDAGDLKKLQKSLSILRVPDVSVTGSDGTIYLRAVNSKSPSTDTFSIAVGVTDHEFDCVFKSENLKLVDSDYNVKVSSKFISRFATKSDEYDIEYFIGVEQNSRFGS